MKIKIGSCSGPLDAMLVRAYFELNEIAFSISTELDIELENYDLERGRDCLRRLYSGGCSLDTTLEAAGYFDTLEDQPAPPRKPFPVERHQARLDKIKAGTPETLRARIARGRN